MLPESRNNLANETHGIFGWERIKAGDRFVIGKEAVIGHAEIIVVVEECPCLCFVPPQS